MTSQYAQRATIWRLISAEWRTKTVITEKGAKLFAFWFRSWVGSVMRNRLLCGTRVPFRNTDTASPRALSLKTRFLERCCSSHLSDFDFIKEDFGISFSRSTRKHARKFEKVFSSASYHRRKSTSFAACAEKGRVFWKVWESTQGFPSMVIPKNIVAWSTLW